MEKPVVIVYGPAGCGKTHNAERLRVLLSCDNIDDGNWDGKSQPAPGTLVLTNRQPPFNVEAQVHAFRDAQLWVSYLRAEWRDSTVVVVNLTGGVWWPDEGTTQEILASDLPLSRAWLICRREPMRGTWKDGA